MQAKSMGEESKSEEVKVMLGDQSKTEMGGYLVSLVVVKRDDFGYLETYNRVCCAVRTC